MNRPARSAVDITDLLRAWRAGGADASEELLAKIYGALKKIAASQLRRERAAHTLQTTALVNEAFLRLLDQQRVDWRDRAHFFGLAATMMRRILVDYARARNAQKRQLPGEHAALSITSVHLPDLDLLDLDRALSRLAEDHPRQARVVEMRYFADLEIEEIADVLEISPATVKRDWQFARVWLRAELAGGPPAT
ncbi:MAG: sigma-70 family RNA polymerase sigma factor [Thermoanaerobaculia bacterium]|nr:sigma-70 family RNA polymerase sigma factor [Thermoanaerobaculia bacterium]MBP9823607.1 sigma-70 family RNA polymerase sigma factor [Thermoanaerobaculia bacterium]